MIKNSHLVRFSFRDHPEAIADHVIDNWIEIIDHLESNS